MRGVATVRIGLANLEKEGLKWFEKSHADRRRGLHTGSSAGVLTLIQAALAQDSLSRWSALRI